MARDGYFPPLLSCRSDTPERLSLITMARTYDRKGWPFIKCSSVCSPIQSGP